MSDPASKTFLTLADAERLSVLINMRHDLKEALEKKTQPEHGDMVQLSTISIFHYRDRDRLREYTINLTMPIEYFDRALAMLLAEIEAELASLGVNISEGD